MLDFSARLACCALICSTNVPPTLPTPTTKIFKLFLCPSKWFSWSTFNALETCFSSITAEIFLSEDPWAMALMLTPLLPNALNIFPETFTCPLIFSPTKAIIDKFVSTLGLLTLPIWISKVNSSFTASIAVSISSGTIAKVIECSEEAWVIKIILTSALESAPNKRAEIPGIPIIPEPDKLRSAILSIELIPLIGIPSWLPTEINVPSSSGAKVFLILIGIPCL